MAYKFKVFGSAGVIANPMDFARNVGIGIKDLLSVSTQGIVQSPSGLFTGIAQGSKGLLSNTVYAISSATTQFSKAAHKGLTGLLQSPIRGPENHGLPGVLSGIAMVTAGLVARPMNG
ncbi:hypothetical protein J5N97_025116 [Dioscorea zingiberensis]|uniref:Vacuolar protein sorting-associated protein 13 DH-like domain-containing protein n=1 Tax=Dioscorea zingiberensis TaxID=325984 RepID=A0A9D5C854_9LILI|nr:hypothetical protein J5N97_025116 [Dioscorea zingiberensis]